MSVFALNQLSKTAPFFVAATLLSAAAGCGGAQSQPAADGSSQASSAPQKERAQAPDFAARDVQGKTVRMSDYLGKDVVLLNFWSTFCEPCLAEFPHIKRILAEQKANGLTVLAVAMDGPETVAQVAPFVQRNQLTFPVLLDEDSTVASLYNPKKSAPLSVLIDRTGAIRSVREGYNPGDEDELERELKELLAEPAR